jgi:hypothetical protein
MSPSSDVFKCCIQLFYIQELYSTIAYPSAVSKCCIQLCIFKCCIQLLFMQVLYSSAVFNCCIFKSCIFKYTIFKCCILVLYSISYFQLPILVRIPPLKQHYPLPPQLHQVALQDEANYPLQVSSRTSIGGNSISGW